MNRYVNWISGSRRGAQAGRLASVATLAIAAALQLGAAPAISAQQADTNAYTIQRTYKAGDVDRYKIELSGAISGMEATGQTGVMRFKMSLVNKETTKSVNADGTAVVKSEVETALAKLGDQELDASSYIPVTTMTRDRRGRVLSMKAEGGAAGPFGPGGDPGQMLSNSAINFYPAAPVKVGDTWKVQPPTGTQKASLFAGGEGTATFVAVEIVGGVRTARIKSLTDAVIKPMLAPEASGVDPSQLPKQIKVHFEGVGNVDLDTGKLVKLTGVVDFEITTDKGSSGKNRIELTSLLDTLDNKPAAGK
jgi:hypothetical protein